MEFDSNMTLRDGAKCTVVAGTHAGKSGTVRDIKKSKTGRVAVTVVQSTANGSNIAKHILKCYAFICI